jgi:hypothetical protein
LKGGSLQHYPYAVENPGNCLLQPRSKIEVAIAEIKCIQFVLAGKNFINQWFCSKEVKARGLKLFQASRFQPLQLFIETSLTETGVVAHISINQ